MGEKSWTQVAAALIQRDGHYLIAQRPHGVHLAGFWEFPGGKRQKGESLEACLRREVQEELGIEISKPIPFIVLRHEYPEKSVELHFFSCSIVKGNPSARECIQFNWVRPEEFALYQFPPADEPVVQKLLNL